MKFFLNAVIYVFHPDDAPGIEMDLWRIMHWQGHYLRVGRPVEETGAWWQAVLDEIESADYFLDLLTPRTAGSLYCRARRDYALALNKPMIPLLREPCDYPAALSERGIVAENVVGLPVHRVLALILQRANATTPAPVSAAVARPPVPVLSTGADRMQIEEVFELADEALVHNHAARAGYFLDEIRALNLPEWNERIRLRLCEHEGEPGGLTAQAYFTRGKQRAARQNFDAAIADFTEALRLQPDFTAAYLERGSVRHDTGDAEGAVTDFTEAIRLQPDFATAYFERAAAHRHTWQPNSRSAAIADYTEAIRLKPDFCAAYANRGIARRDIEDYDGAIADYTQALHLRSEDDTLYILRGDAYMQKRDPARALEDYEAALRLNPYSGEARRRIDNLRSR